MYFFLSSHAYLLVLWGENAILETISFMEQFIQGQGQWYGRGSYGDEGGERTTLSATDPIILLSFSYSRKIFSTFEIFCGPCPSKHDHAGWKCENFQKNSASGIKNLIYTHLIHDPITNKLCYLTFTSQIYFHVPFLFFVVAKVQALFSLHYEFVETASVSFIHC